MFKLVFKHFFYYIISVTANLPPVFTQDMNNVVLSESTAVGSVVFTLEGYDPEKSKITFGSLGTDNFKVDPDTGDVVLVKALDREVISLYTLQHAYLF